MIPLLLPPAQVNPRPVETAFSAQALKSAHRALMVVVRGGILEHQDPKGHAQALEALQTILDQASPSLQAQLLPAGTLVRFLREGATRYMQGEVREASSGLRLTRRITCQDGFEHVVEFGDPMDFWQVLEWPTT